MPEDDIRNFPFLAKKSFGDLPLEVVSHIFTFLTVSDIQVSRLVCSDWYMASQAPVLLEREKTVCSSDLDDSSYDFLLSRNRQFFNFSFVGDLHIAWYNAEFWRKFGSTLRSLSLTYSNITEVQLLKLLTYCQKLRSLEIDECQFLFRSHQTLAEFIDCSPTSPTLAHLEHLKIANIFDPSLELFEKLVHCAPNLKSLALDDCVTTSSSSKNGSRGLTYDHVVTYLREKPHRIQALHLTCCEEEDDAAIVVAATLPNLQLIKLQTDYSNVAALLTRQRWLQDIELTCNADDSLLISVCQNLPDLKHLSLPYCSQVTLSGMRELPALEKLISLRLLQCCQVSGDAFLKALCQKTNRTLRKLTITELGLVSHLHVVAMAKALPCLTHLDLSCCVGVTDWSVQAIFKYQKSLQSLSLVQCRNLTDFGLIGSRIYHFRDIWDSDLMVCQLLRDLECDDEWGILNPTGHGISNLENLQKLDLNFCKITGDSFKRGLCLPSIRHLVLDNNIWISKDAFECLFDNNRTIEILELSNCGGVNDSLVPIIVEKLKRLRSIDIEDCDQVSEESIRILKQHCRKVKE